MFYLIGVGLFPKQITKEAIDVIATKIVVLIVLIAMITEQESFIDVALVYGMIGFIATITVSKYLEKGKLF